MRAYYYYIVIVDFMYFYVSAVIMFFFRNKHIMFVDTLDMEVIEEKEQADLAELIVN